MPPPPLIPPHRPPPTRQLLRHDPMHTIIQRPLPTCAPAGHMALAVPPLPLPCTSHPLPAFRERHALQQHHLVLLPFLPLHLPYFPPLLLNNPQHPPHILLTETPLVSPVHSNQRVIRRRGFRRALRIQPPRSPAPLTDPAISQLDIAMLTIANDSHHARLLLSPLRAPGLAEGEFGSIMRARPLPTIRLWHGLRLPASIKLFHRFLLFLLGVR